jgi:hypothetical protein
MNNGALIRLFNYSQLKIKQGKASNKVCHYVFSYVMASVELTLNNKRHIQFPFLPHIYNAPSKESQKQKYKKQMDCYEIDEV